MSNLVTEFIKSGGKVTHVPAGKKSTSKKTAPPAPVTEEETGPTLHQMIDSTADGPVVEGLAVKVVTETAADRKAKAKALFAASSADENKARLIAVLSRPEGAALA